MLTKDEAIRAACGIQALVYKAHGNYERASDCFCDMGGRPTFGTFQNAGHTLAYVLKATVAALQSDGLPIDPDIRAEIEALLGVEGER